MKPRNRSILGLLILFVALTATVQAAAQPSRPRLLVLPWLVIDRTSNRECGRDEVDPPAAAREARELGTAAQAALDSAMHDHRAFEMIPRREWQSVWTSYAPRQVYHATTECAVCTQPKELLRYDPAILKTLADSSRADYVWLGVVVVPLTRDGGGSKPDECCRAALGQGRIEVLARSSALLVRVRDGVVVWQQDSRRLERDEPVRVGKVNRTPAVRRAFAVRETAHLLGNAFRREHSPG